MSNVETVTHFICDICEANKATGKTAGTIRSEHRYQCILQIGGLEEEFDLCQACFDSADVRGGGAARNIFKSAFAKLFKKKDSSTKPVERTV